jgi:hypothetical protein
MKYRICGRILLFVLLMSFWKNPVYGERLTTPLMDSEGSGMRLYSDSEIEVLIEELSEAAEEAIEKAAVEAARATALASLERESAAIREAQRLQGENSRLKQDKVKAALVTGVICFFGGLALGAGSIAILTH